jgi:hypothetical protein
MSALRMLAPPYRQLAWPSDGVPPLGAVAIAVADSAESVAGDLRPFLRRAPWCIPCLVTGSATATPRVLIAIHELPGQPAFIAGPVADGGLEAPVAAAVRSRPVPGGARLADFVVRRTGRGDLRLELSRLLAAPSAGPVVSELPGRTLRDRLRRFGTFGSHCWRAVGALCRLGTKQDGGSIERLATSVGIGPRTLRSWVRRYLDVTIAEYRTRIGWEWVLEAALRHGGYVEAPQWSKPYSLRPGAIARTSTGMPSTMLVSHRSFRRWSRPAAHDAVELSAVEPASDSPELRVRALPVDEGFD